MRLPLSCIHQLQEWQELVIYEAWKAVPHVMSEAWKSEIVRSHFYRVLSMGDLDEFGF